MGTDDSSLSSVIRLLEIEGENFEMGKKAGRIQIGY